jgi:hypothetical protein
MTEFPALAQRVLLSLATTVDLWRDLAVMGLAALVIGLLWLAAEASS